MRVLFAITKGEVGGAQEHVRILARGMVERGHHVGAVVHEPSALATSLADAGATVLPWASIGREVRPWTDVRARAELRDAVETFAPAVLSVHSSKAVMLGASLAPLRGTVIVATCHHAPFGPRRRAAHRLVARPASEITLRRADGIISVGSRDMPLLAKVAPAVPIRLVRNAVPGVTDPRAPTIPTRRALWVARLRDPKDPLLAVEAWERVAERFPDAELTICGDGPLAPAVARRVARSSARDNIHLAGLVPDLAPHHANHSVFLLATTVEGGSTMATLEAMTHGLVPVLSDAGDAFLYTHADCGVVVQPGSARALAAGVVGLFDDRERMAAMRERAIAFVRSWTVDDMVDATLDVYDEVRARKRR